MDLLKQKHIDILDQGSMRPAWAVAYAERLMKAYKTQSFWGFVDEVMKVWEKVHPKQWSELIHEVKLTKEDLKDKKFATTRSRMERRLILRMPSFVHHAIFKMYPDYQMDRKFFYTFAKRFPAFKIPDQI